MGLTYGQGLRCIKDQIFNVWADLITNGYTRKDQCGEDEVVAAPQFKVLGEPQREIYIPSLTEERQRIKNPDEGRHYAKFYTRHTAADQPTLRGAVDQPGVRYRNHGILFVDLYFSKQAYKESDEEFLVELVQWIFRNEPVTDADVDFSNCHPTRRSGPDQFYVTSVTSNYKFDEFKI